MDMEVGRVILNCMSSGRRRPIVTSQILLNDNVALNDLSHWSSHGEIWVQRTQSRNCGSSPKTASSCVFSFARSCLPSTLDQPSISQGHII